MDDKVNLSGQWNCCPSRPVDTKRSYIKRNHANIFSQEYTSVGFFFFFFLMSSLFCHEQRAVLTLPWKLSEHFGVVLYTGRQSWPAQCSELCSKPSCKFRDLQMSSLFICGAFVYPVVNWL